jgi:hypothetical protein
MREQDPEFRKEEVQYVMKRFQAVESCSLIGVGSIGKSNLLQHISNDKTKAYYLSQTKATITKSVIIDANLLGPMKDDDQFKCWAGYELMMHRLYLAFYPFEMLGEDAETFYEVYQALQDGTNPLYAYMGLRYFELGMEFFFRRGYHLVFMFDEFEEFMRLMPSKFFQSLRGLRDNHKTQLSYLTFSRKPLTTLVQEYQLSSAEVEPFIELFNDNEYFVGPYNQRDTSNMLNSLLKRHNLEYPDWLKVYLLTATGGFAGILRATFQVIGSLNAPSLSQVDITQKLINRKPVHVECETIWKGLTTEEQVILKAALGVHVEVNHINQNAINLLVLKRLLKINADKTGYTIEPLIFREFLAIHLA